MKADTIVLSTGEEVPCQLVVAATGYKPTRTFLPKAVSEAKEKDGMWLYRQMIHPDHPNLVFLNSEVTTFTNITTASIQARWLVELLAGNHEFPDAAGMRASIQKMQESKRATMPNAGGARAYMIQTHQVHYYDQLLKDMGANCRRKSGNFFVAAAKEIFDPYRPRDYKHIVDGEFKYLKGEKMEPGSKQWLFLKECVGFLVGMFLIIRFVTIFLAGLRVSYSTHREL